MTELLIAIVAFVGLHFLLSHPLREPIVRRIGERPFLGVYSLIAGATLVWAIIAYGRAPSVQLWVPPAWAPHLVWLLMLIASILFAGSLISPNPAIVMAGKKLGESREPVGMMRITRHPMMWAFAIWAAAHIFVSGRLETLILAGGIGVLALIGAKLQDGKKARQLGDGWRAYAAKTSYWPFGAQVSGRLPWRTLWPGGLPVIGGVMLYAVLVFLHPSVIGHSTGLIQALS